MPSRQHLHRLMPLVDSQSSPRVHPVRPFLRAEELCVGCIVWLPDMIETTHVQPFRISDDALRTEGYYHPVVILGFTPRPAPAQISELKICFALLTTFRGVKLMQYEITKESLRPSIPIVDTPNPGNSQYLHLENRGRLRKQSYIRLESVYETSIANLRSYVPDIDLPAYHLRLDKESYLKLMSLLSLDAQDYLETETLKQARYIRNDASTLTSTEASATTQSAPFIPAPIAAQDLRDPPRRAPDPTLTQNLHDSLVPKEPPSSLEPASTPLFLQSRPSPAQQPRGDMFFDSDLRIPLIEPSLPCMASSATTAAQLPAPVQHRAERGRSRRRNARRPCSVEGGFALAAVFCFFVMWVLVAGAAWLLWRRLSG